MSKKLRNHTVSDAERKKLTRRAAFEAVLAAAGPTVGAIAVIRHRTKHVRH